MKYHVYTSQTTESYELIDSGNGRKLERFGTYRLIRPDPRALWQPKAPKKTWDTVDAAFVGQSGEDDRMRGEWKIHKHAPDPWIYTHGPMTLSLRSGEFKNIGVFPEQATNWEWLTNTIDGQPLQVLNLFAYTGAASLASALAGARVTHVDSVKSIVSWASENAKASGLEHDKIRWIVDDVGKFVAREARRGMKYDGIIMDPPRFGRGANGEIWKLTEHLPGLLTACRDILASSPSFLLLNAYTADLSAIAIANVLADTVGSFGGDIMYGDLALQESHSGRLLPSGIVARWKKE